MAAPTRRGWRDRYNAFIECQEAAWELTFGMLALAFVRLQILEEL